MKRFELLLVEDDLRVRDLIIQSLEPLGTNIHWESNGREAEQRIREYLPSVVVLDLGLPELSGLEVLERIQPWFKGSVIVVSAWDDEEKKLRAFELGVEDYVSKPFSPRELQARVRVALRRAATRNAVGTSVGSRNLEYGDLSLVPSEHQIKTGRGETLPLTQTEFTFLSVLLQAQGGLVTQTRLLELVWGPNHLEDSHYLRIMVSKIRKKFEAHQVHLKIQTELGLGYRLFSPDSTHERRDD